MKINFLKIFIVKSLATILFLSFLLFPFHSARAAAWPAIDPTIKTAMETVMKVLNGMLLGVAKKMAIKAVQTATNAAVSGGNSGGPMFVTDWEDYLIESTKEEANLYINDYISKITANQGSASSYEGIGGSSINDYIASMRASAEAITSNTRTPQITYRGDPSQAFADPKNGITNFLSSLSGINSKYMLATQVGSEYKEYSDEKKFINQTKVISGQGFTGTESTPGIIIKELLTKSQGMGFDMITNAQNIPEVITAAVTLTISQTINQGIGNIQAKIDKEVNGLQNKIDQQTNTSIGINGPSAAYKW